MYILYIDEAGCPGSLPGPTSDVQPIFCIAGLILPQNELPNVTAEFLDLKRRFNPSYASTLSHDLEIMLYEIKGSNLRSDIKNGTRNIRRRAVGILDKTINIIENYNGKLIARTYIKEPGGSFSGNAVYTSAIQTLCENFQNFLAANNTTGIVVADSRKKNQNNKVSFSIFTKKFKMVGDEYPNILEMPVFGHSENHVGLQISDWIASAILFPSLAHVYCSGYVNNVHIHPQNQLIKDRFIEKIKALQYRYVNGGRYVGGISVSDGILRRRSSSYLFR